MTVIISCFILAPAGDTTGSGNQSLSAATMLA